MKTTIIVKGTHCESCKALIEDVASEIPGITSCTVDYKTGITVVEHEGSVDWGAFKKEVEGLGEYKVEMPA